MKKRLFSASHAPKILLAAFFISLLSACQTIGPQTATSMAGAGQGDAAAFVSRPALTSQRAPEWVATSASLFSLGVEDRTLVAFDMLSDKKIALGPVQPGSVVVDPRIAASGNSVVVLWQETLTNDEGKRQQSVWVRTSHDGGLSYAEAFELGRDGLIVANAAIAFDNQEGAAPRLIALEWDVEARTPLLRFYSLSSKDEPGVVVVGGVAEENLSNFRLVVDGQRLLAVWMTGNQGNAIMQTSESNNGGQSWSAAQALKGAEGAAGVQLLQGKSGQVLSWMGDNNNTLHVMTRAGNGTEWTALQNTPERGEEGELIGYRIRLSADDAVHLLYGWRPDQELRGDVFHSVAFNGQGFDAPQRLNTSQPANMATAAFPDIAFDADGQRVLAVWQDLRYFRPTVMGNMSRDGGKTWLQEDFAINARVGGETAMLPAVSTLKNGLMAVVWTHFGDTRFQGQKAQATVLDLEQLRKMPVPAPNLPRLEQRLKAYWNARKADDNDATYLMYDPFYAEGISLEGHKTMHSRVKVYIYDYSVEKMEAITPQRYKVTTRYEHEVKPFMLKGGEEAKVERAWVEGDQEWIWIDGDWHLVFVDMYKKPIVRF